MGDRSKTVVIFSSRLESALPNKEATARIKINKLLEAAGWRFFTAANCQPTSSSSWMSKSRLLTWMPSATAAT